MNNVISFERLLEVTSEDLNIIRQDIEEAYASETDEETKQCLLADANRRIGDWHRYYARYNEILNSKLTETEKENAILRHEVNRLSKENQEIKEENTKLYINISAIKERAAMHEEVIRFKDNTMHNMQETLENELVESTNKINEMLELVEENIKAISLSKKIKREPKVNIKGEGHPRYIGSINNDELIADYNTYSDTLDKNGNLVRKYTLRDLSAKYKISIAGIRNRLIDLGVYEKQYNTKNN